LVFKPNEFLGAQPHEEQKKKEKEVQTNGFTSFLPGMKGQRRRVRGNAGVHRGLKKTAFREHGRPFVHRSAWGGKAKEKRRWRQDRAGTITPKAVV